MSKIRLYFMQIWDKNGVLHEIKTNSWKEIISFVKRNSGSVNRIDQGNRMVPENKLQHCIDNVSIKDLMTLPEEE